MSGPYFFAKILLIRFCSYKIRLDPWIINDMKSFYRSERNQFFSVSFARTGQQAFENDKGTRAKRREQRPTIRPMLSRKMSFVKKERESHPEKSTKNKINKSCYDNGRRSRDIGGFRSPSGIGTIFFECYFCSVGCCSAEYFHAR